MPTGATSSASPAVAILILLAGGAVLYAWWLSIDRSRRFRDLVRWLKENRAQAWSEIPRAAWISPSGEINHLRHHSLAQDPEFAKRYRDATRHNRRQLAMLLLAAAGIGMVAAGTRYWGWVW